MDNQTYENRLKNDAAVTAERKKEDEQVAAERAKADAEQVAFEKNAIANAKDDAEKQKLQQHFDQHWKLTVETRAKEDQKIKEDRDAQDKYVKDARINHDINLGVGPNPDAPGRPVRARRRARDPGQ